MLYEAFNGGVSASSAANTVVDTLGSFIPAEEVGAATTAITQSITVIANKGQISWAQVGSGLTDIANAVLQFTPYAKFGDIISALWNVSSLL